MLMLIKIFGFIKLIYYNNNNENILSKYNNKWFNIANF